MMAREKIINLRFDDQSKQVVFFSSWRNFENEIENMFSVFSSSFSINLLAFYHFTLRVESLQYKLN